MNISSKMPSKLDSTSIPPNLKRFICALETSLSERCDSEKIEKTAVNQVMGKMLSIINSSSDHELRNDLSSIEIYSRRFYQFEDELFKTIEKLQQRLVGEKSMISFHAKSFFERFTAVADREKEKKELKDKIATSEKKTIGATYWGSN